MTLSLSHWCPWLGVCLIVSIPDLCHFSYFYVYTDNPLGAYPYEDPMFCDFKMISLLYSLDKFSHVSKMCEIKYQNYFVVTCWEMADLLALVFGV